MDSPSQPPKPTHYEILNLNPSTLDSDHNDPAALLKKAYHRALLRNHPDKSAAQTLLQQQQQVTYTVDQISTSFAVLSSPRLRAEYDASLRLIRPNDVTGSGGVTAGFQTGVENIDLDDLAFDDREERWHRACRCGNDRGFSFQEHDLMEAGDEGLLMVGCQDCSLWLRVHFAMLEDDDNENDVAS